MAAPLRRSLPSLRRALLTPAPARTLSAEASDALVEIKPGEIGMVSGIPAEHLRRKVTRCIPSLLCSVFIWEMVAGVIHAGVLRDVRSGVNTGTLGLDHCVGCGWSMVWDTDAKSLFCFVIDWSEGQAVN
ncbi:unnamed protein product [Miscanthus lutarioriparius]|uniref:Uncharacterized protein n=1 Tax=Miscanthus lutarioriparius TaxID=422564 RepID=A0A811NFP9_9POAL|nr:unnamed protein product [Miscanthus lutarioriparius]